MGGEKVGMSESGLIKICNIYGKMGDHQVTNKC